MLCAVSDDATVDKGPGKHKVFLAFILKCRAFRSVPDEAISQASVRPQIEADGQTDLLYASVRPKRFGETPVM
jgi:hypothetical protein